MTERPRPIGGWHASPDTDLSCLRAEIALQQSERALLQRRGRAEGVPQIDALVDHYVAAV